MSASLKLPYDHKQHINPGVAPIERFYRTYDWLFHLPLPHPPQYQTALKNEEEIDIRHSKVRALGTERRNVLYRRRLMPDLFILKAPSSVHLAYRESSSLMFKSGVCE